MVLNTGMDQIYITKARARARTSTIRPFIKTGPALFPYFVVAFYLTSLLPLFVMLLRINQNAKYIKV